MKQTGTVAVLEWCLIFFLLSAQGLAQQAPTKPPQQPQPPSFVTLKSGVDVSRIPKQPGMDDVAILKLNASEYSQFDANPKAYLVANQVFPNVTLKNVYHYHLSAFKPTATPAPKTKSKPGGDPSVVCSHNDYSNSVCVSN